MLFRSPDVGEIIIWPRLHNARFITESLWILSFMEFSFLGHEILIRGQGLFICDMVVLPILDFFTFKI